VDWDVAAAEAAMAIAREGLLRGLLRGELPKLLNSFAPAALKSAASVADPMKAGQVKSYASQGMSSALACHLAKSFEGNRPVPAAQCEVDDAAEDLVRRLSSGAGFAEFCAQRGVGLEALPDMVSAMRAKDAAFGRLLVSMDWHTSLPIDAHTFEVPIMTAGRCPWHPHPICYAQTTEDDIFVVIISYAGVADVPREEDAFAACTEILRALQPLDPAPYSAMRFTSFCATSPVRMTEIEHGNVLEGRSSSTLHVAEFGSLLLSAGRTMPGRLTPGPSAPGAAQVFAVEKPYIISLWHEGLDAMNVPLAATLVS